jgi:flagellum-specific peptidoglycan hydrolase FlgJ
MMKINRFTLLIVIALTFRAIAFGQDNTAKYINTHKPIAIDLMREYSIPASVILGIAVIESGSGTSLLCKKFNNHFGIVGKNYNAISKLGRKSHYKEYVNDSASYRHFCEVISRKAYYKQLRSNPDPNLWITAIKHSGYATAAHTWSYRVDKVIRKFRLTEIDFFVDPLNETADLLISR